MASEVSEQVIEISQYHYVGLLCAGEGLKYNTVCYQVYMIRQHGIIKQQSATQVRTV